MSYQPNTYKNFYKVVDRNDTCYFVNPFTKEYFYTYDIQDTPLANLVVSKVMARILFRHLFNAVYKGDFVTIVYGKKFIGETKQVKDIFDYTISGHTIKYFRFTDNTIVAIKNCNSTQEPLTETTFANVLAR